MASDPVTAETELVEAYQRGEAFAELRHLVGDVVALEQYCRRVISGESRTSPLQALVHIRDTAAAALARVTVIDKTTGRTVGHDLEEREPHVSRNDGPVQHA